jgi:hypothetical protein
MPPNEPPSQRRFGIPMEIKLFFTDKLLPKLTSF